MELNIEVGDPARWPRNLFTRAGWDPPEGVLPPNYVRWGGVAIAENWLRTHGYKTIPRSSISNHVAYHVPVVATDPAELAANGILHNPSARASELLAEEPIDPSAYLRYYAKGVQLGIKGLEIMQRQLDTLVSEGKPVPMDVLKAVIETGSRLATSQAGIKARGVELHKVEEDDAFRMADPNLSQPMNGNRIRTIEGESVVIKDAGRGDRMEYNERAKMEARDPIPT
jgi:hypothetical protein